MRNEKKLERSQNLDSSGKKDVDYIPSERKATERF